MESDESPMDPSTAAAQLAELRTDRAQLADRAVPPWWYDPCLGLVVFVLVSAIAVRNSGWWYFATLGAGFAGLGALVAAGAVLGVALTFLGRWWTRVYVAELREGL
jgi:hypothetical protein